MAQGHNFGEIKNVTASIFLRDKEEETFDLMDGDWAQKKFRIEVLQLMGSIMSKDAILKVKSEHNAILTLDFNKFFTKLDETLEMDAGVRYVAWLKKHRKRPLAAEPNKVNKVPHTTFDWGEAEAILEEDDGRMKKRVKLEDNEDVAV